VASTNQITSQYALPKKKVTITHPLHPLYGQEFDVIRIYRVAAFPNDPDLIIQAPNFHGAVNASWTDYHASEGEQITNVNTSGLLDLKGLRQIAALLDQWCLGEQADG
jgi:hypothetical protein